MNDQGAEHLAGRLQATLVSLLHSAPHVRGVVIALSGGMDSMVLLDLCAQLQHNIPRRAIHINHGLHPDADDWQRHCEMACAQRAIPCQSFSLHLRDKLATQGQGLEALARKARYQAFANSLAADEVLLTAHHAQDQGETVLFRLLRGAGPRGLAGMQQTARLPISCADKSPGHTRARLWRPLLNESPDTLRAYARQQQLSWVEDSSNQDTNFSRNFLRHKVIPQIQAHWPGWLSALEKSASACRETDVLLQALATQWLQQCQGKQPGHLSVSALLNHTRPERDVILRQWLWEKSGQWAGRTMLAQLSALLSAAEDRQPQLVWQGHTIRRYRDELLLTAALPDLPDSPPGGFAWNLSPSPLMPAQLPPEQVAEVLELPGNGQLRLLAVPGSTTLPAMRWPEASCTVRYREEGIRARLPGRPAKSLKQLWQEAGVPPWLRDRAPLLYIGNELAWIAGVGVCEGFEAPASEAGWQPEWQIPGDRDAKMHEQGQS